MNMKGNNSIENLYPPSYGSRASSSLSLGSSGVYNRSLPSTKLHPDSPNMYSSLPMVFHATSQDRRASQDRLAPNDLSNDRTNHLSSKQTGQKRFYGPHFYTPSRRKKQNVSPLKNSGLQDGEMPVCGAALFRSSSDGKAQKSPSDPRSLMNTHTLKLDDMPPLGPGHETTLTFDDSNSEVSFSAGVSESTPARQENMKSDNNSSFEYSEVVISTKTDDDDNGDFSFPSLPPVPSADDEQHIEDSAESVEFAESKKDFVVSEDLSPVLESDLQSESILEDNKPSKKNHQATPTQETRTEKTAFLPEKQNNISLVRESYTGSVAKLGKMFGPEFKTLRGLHAGEKKVSLKLCSWKAMPIPLFVQQTATKIPLDRRTVDVVLLNGRVVQFIVEVG